MSDSILNETIQTVSTIPQEKQIKQLLNDNVGHPPTANQPPAYFRYKGIKVKFEDIEQVLQASKLVNKAMVLSAEDMEGNRKLVAYIIAEEKFNEAAIAKYLEGKLPEYMLPELYIVVDKFSLMPDGKIDKSALPLPGIGDVINKKYVAPRNETEARLVNIIQKLLGIQQVSVEDNFFHLGGGSLQALRVISAIRNEFDLTLDVKFFFVYPTIAGIAGHLSQMEALDSAIPSLAKWALNHSGSIIPIKLSGTKKPLYIVCGGGGSAFTFQKFAHMLEDDQPVYALQQPSDGTQLESFPSTIETIAARYVEEILQVDQDGPFALSGHCIGGFIALEMARKLQSMGKKIKLLALFDVVLSKHTRRQQSIFKQPQLIPALIRKAISKAYLKFNFETFLFTRHPKDAVEYKINSLKSFANKIYRFKPEDTEYKIFRQFEQKFETALENYEVKKYDGDMLVFYARDHYHFLDKNRNIRFRKFVLEEEIKNMWNDYAASVTMYEMDGEHSTMFEPFYSRDFANLLQLHLNKGCK